MSWAVVSTHGITGSARGDRSLRQHLVEDHGKPAPEVERSAMAGPRLARRGCTGITWADQYDVPHPGDNPFRQFRDLWRVPRSRLGTSEAGQ